MKKLLFFNWLIALCAAAMMVSCGGDAGESCGMKEIAVDVKGAQESLVLSDNGTCELIYAPEWVNASIDKNVLHYNIAKNDTSEPRESCIVVKSGNKTLSIPVRQGVKATYLMLSKNKINMKQEGDMAKVAVITNGGEVTVQPGNNAKATLNGDYLTITSEKNDGIQKIETIKVKSGKLTKTISVIIAGKKCPTCNSTGYLTCKKCGGQGYFCNAPLQGSIITACRACGGRGEAILSRAGDSRAFRSGSGKVPCPTCNSNKKK